MSFVEGHCPPTTSIVTPLIYDTLGTFRYNENLMKKNVFLILLLRINVVKYLFNDYARPKEYAWRSIG